MFNLSKRLRLFICNVPSCEIKSRHPEKNKIRKSIKISFWENFFAAGMGGVMQDYIVPYALALKATTKQIGLLSSLSYLCASLVQLKSADFTDKQFSRRSLILFSTFMHAVMIMPILLIPYFIKSNQIFWLILFNMLFVGFNTLGQGAFVSLLNDYTPANRRGSFFGWRGKIGGLVSVSFSLLAGLIMQFFKNDIIRGVGIILIIAMLARFLSWYCLTKMYDPPFHRQEGSYFSFLDFIKRARESNFARFVFFIAGMSFAINIAGPFFAVFMLKDMHFSYITYVLIVTVTNIVSLVLGARWGRLADKIGNVRVMQFTAWFIITFPFLWIVCHHPLYLMALQLVGGFAYSGFNLAAGNFVYDATTPAKRIRCFSYFNVINSASVSVGALLGGYLAMHCPRIFGYQLLFVFMVSGICRLIIVSFFSFKIKEVRRVEAIAGTDIVKNILFS